MRGYANRWLVACVLSTTASPGCHKTSPERVFTRNAALERARATHPKAALPADRLPPDVLAEEEMTFREIGGQRLGLDLYRPRRPGPHPAVLIVHGGGWARGDRRMERPFAKRLAAAGFVAVPVSYRLGPAGRFPNALLDVKAAVRWLREHAHEHDVDGARIGAVGGSAGGHLVALLGASNGEARFDRMLDTTLAGDAGTKPSRASTDISTNVAAVVDIDGLADFTGPELLAKEAATPGGATNFLGGSYATRADVWRDASPIFHVTPASAPTLFINSTSPTPILPGRHQMQQRLAALGIASSVLVMPDTPHPFWLLDPWFEPTLNAVEGFLTAHLGRRP